MFLKVNNRINSCNGDLEFSRKLSNGPLFRLVLEEIINLASCKIVKRRMINKIWIVWKWLFNYRACLITFLLAEYKHCCVALSSISFFSIHISGVSNSRSVCWITLLKSTCSTEEENGNLQIRFSARFRWLIRKIGK